jgi:hypothetical protein
MLPDLCVPESAPLHSPGKGANKTPPVCVVFGLPQVGYVRSLADVPAFPGRRFAARVGKPAKTDA